MIDKARDARWSKEVMKTTKGICLHCGKKATGVHHIIPRSIIKLRWILQNGIPTCNILHRMFEGNKYERYKAIKKYVSMKRYGELWKYAHRDEKNKIFQEVK